MAKTVVVVGATGGQGGSVISALLGRPGIHIRGITRNIHSPKAQTLAAKGVEMVTADLDNESTLAKAFEGASVIWAVTDFFEPFSKHGPELAMEIEHNQGVNMARAASKTTTLEHYIWSTLANPMKISNGKYLIPHFEELLKKTTFLWVTYFASNLLLPLFLPNKLESAGKYVWLQPTPPTTPVVAVGNQEKNVGIFVSAILDHPELTLPGKFVRADTESLTKGELLEIWGRVTGKPTQYVQISLDDFDSLFPQWGREMGLMLKFWEEVGEKSWSGEEGILSGNDLGVKYLEGVEEAFGHFDWNL
ncbi:hypothetical protein H2201_008559 [Coniosporium apollinis]|uniref:NmrA-like domain-containing protein n=1 Tax=Coniosporium apollinis TaxID=61459 RepID=A0ABQ9NGA5_9PEZI|nr:hypothetical protein H2201_008559 [Coniosporium apollinis]